MIFVVINIALSIVPLAVAKVRVRSESWQGVGLLFSVLGLFALVVAVVLAVVDFRQGRLMHRSERHVGEEVDEELEGGEGEFAKKGVSTSGLVRPGIGSVIEEGDTVCGRQFLM